MKKEIGSEYHRVNFDDSIGITYPISGALVFSGRTAIETVLKNLSGAKTAILPSYCCESMIQPFRDLKIEVEFYSVNYDGGLKIDVKNLEGISILFWCNYFGFNVPMPDFSKFKEHGGVIIEDVTHSFLSKQVYHSQSDYLISSLRKWEPINCGGYCARANGNLQHVPERIPLADFIRIKTSAMELKSKYLSDYDAKKKEKYLLMFEKSNRWLAQNYSELVIDSWSRHFLETVNIEEQKRIRKRNAHILFEGLKGKVQFLFSEAEMDCPLFIPILLQGRDAIRSALIEKEIYCPVHWPRPDGCESNLYDLELSLICDQRYSELDMERMVSILRALL